MSDESALFDAVATALGDETSMDPLAARGTLRLALRKAGLEPRGLDAGAMRAVIERILPDELGVRGIENPAAVCERLASRIPDAAPAAGGTPDRASSAAAVFQRLSGS